MWVQILLEGGIGIGCVRVWGCGGWTQWSDEVVVRVGFITGILQVGNLNTIPISIYTVPISGMGTYCTHSAVMSYETCSIFGTHGLLV